MNTLRAQLVFLIALVSPVAMVAQSSTASINGLIDDPSNAAIPEASVTALNTETGVSSTVKTSNKGLYVISGLTPGNYRIEVTKEGFRSAVEEKLMLHVQDNVRIDLHLVVGSSSESLTVTANEVQMNTSDATVSTVVDRKFIENMPLNGRSLQSLISLAPGVVKTPIPYGASPDQSGEFSVNGQRTEANYYTVDGVSANVGVGVNGIYTAGTAGLTPSQTALGTTQSIASVDALQEFRINTSTYSAEYGRLPGGQISLQTRSGTDQLHGTVFDYLRNDALDANNWFNNHTYPPAKRTAERQNDFGGTIGGPIHLPRVYSGLHRSFFFYSYEGLRLAVPTPALVTQVPSDTLRQTTARELQPLIKAFPRANGNPVPGADGLAFFTGSYSLPGVLNTHSIRIDHRISSRENIFARYSDSTSSSRSRSSGNLANLGTAHFITRSLTSGLIQTLADNAVNDARFNYTWTENTNYSSLDSFGGATPQVLKSLLPTVSTPYAQFNVFLMLGTNPGFSLYNFLENQTQINATDTQQFLHNHHLIKIGVDYRRLDQTQYANQVIASLRYNAQQLAGNVSGTLYVNSNGPIPPEPIFNNFSAFAEDEWKVGSHTTLSYGLRWDLNPPPTNGSGRIPPVLDQIDNLATAKLAPEGTPLWNTDHLGFAPRFGMASQIVDHPGRETVLRLGVGNFLDLGETLAGLPYQMVGFGSSTSYAGVSFPLSSSLLTPAPGSTATPYNAVVVGYTRNPRLPYSLQWNVSVEQGLGTSRSLTLGYVASAGRRMLNGFYVNPAAVNPDFSTSLGAYLIRPSGYSNYDSLQAQFQQKMSHGLQMLASYTWSHCIDNASSSFVSYRPLLKGDCDFDIGNNFQFATTYDAPKLDINAFSRVLTRDWSLDVRAFSRSSAPVDILGNGYYAADGSYQYARPNLLPGIAHYLYGSRSSIPGGRQVNFAAFQSTASIQGNAPRNFIRGFGATQIDFAVRREFHLTERTSLQFRAEAFNILNHPIFGAVTNTLSSSPTLFGQAKNTLNISLGNQSSLYEQGGPRSLQLSLKVLF